MDGYLHCSQFGAYTYAAPSCACVLVFLGLSFLGERTDVNKYPGLPGTPLTYVGCPGVLSGYSCHLVSKIWSPLS